MDDAVFLAAPSYMNEVHTGSVLASLDCLRSRRKVVYNQASYAAGSLIPKSFGACLGTAIVKKCRWLAMIHADVEAGPGWLDVMLDELARLDATVVSAVIPLKTDEGVTSTAIDVPVEDDDKPHETFGPRETLPEALERLRLMCLGDPLLAQLVEEFDLAITAPEAGLNVRHMTKRRLTLKETRELPETFCAADIPHDGPLLVNTGLWVADLSRPCWRKIAFQITSRVRYWEDDAGVLQSHLTCESEDWIMSRHLHALGEPVYATRKVRLLHHGRRAYDNYTDWGLAVDPQQTEQLA